MGGRRAGVAGRSSEAELPWAGCRRSRGKGRPGRSFILRQDGEQWRSSRAARYDPPVGRPCRSDCRPHTQTRRFGSTVDPPARSGFAINSGDLLMTQICQSDREIEDVAYEWKRAMIEKGWSGGVRAKAEERARRMLPSMFGVRDADAHDVGSRHCWELLVAWSRRPPVRSVSRCSGCSPSSSIASCRTAQSFPWRVWSRACWLRFLSTGRCVEAHGRWPHGSVVPVTQTVTAMRLLRIPSRSIVPIGSSSRRWTGWPAVLRGDRCEVVFRSSRVQCWSQLSFIE